MNQQREIETRQTEAKLRHPELDSGSSKVPPCLDSGIRRNDDCPRAVVIPIQVARIDLAAGAKLLYGRCAAEASEQEPEFVFDTQRLAEDLGCHASTICRRKEMLMKKHLLEYTGRKKGRYKIYRLVWDFIEHVADTVKRVLRKILPRKVRKGSSKIGMSSRAPESSSGAPNDENSVANRPACDRAVLDRAQIARALMPSDSRIDNKAMDWVPDQVRNDEITTPLTATLDHIYFGNSTAFSTGYLSR